MRPALDSAIQFGPRIPQSHSLRRRPLAERLHLDRDFGGIALTIVVAIAATAAGIGNDFANDDLALIARSDRLHDLTAWRELFTLPYWPPPFSPDLYRPVTSAVLAVEYAFGNGAPIAFRVISYLLYAATAVGVFLLAKRVVGRGLAVLAAVLFAAHPVHVEAVALAVGQSELIVAGAAIVMTILYLDGCRSDGGISRGRWAALAGLYLVACLAKEQGLVLPGLLIAVEVSLISGDITARVRSRLLGYLLLLAVAAFALLLRKLVLHEIGGTFTAEALISLGIRDRALTMLAVVPQWVRLLAWPAHLRGDYSPQEIVAATSVGLIQVVGAAIVAAAVAIARLARKRAPAITFGLLFCAVGLFPVSNVLVPTGIVLAERTLFLPSIGFVIAVAGAAGLLFADTHPAAKYRGEAVVAVVILTLLGVARSAERELVWRNEGYFVAREVRDAPKSYRAQQAFGNLLFEVGQLDLARDAFARALQLAPPSVTWRVHNAYAEALNARGDSQGEVDQWRASLTQRPDQGYQWGQLVVAELLLGKYADARRDVDSGESHGANRSVFDELRTVADSAMTVHAPPGTIKISLRAGPVSAVRE